MDLLYFTSKGSLHSVSNLFIAYMYVWFTPIFNILLFKKKESGLKIVELLLKSVLLRLVWHHRTELVRTDGQLYITGASSSLFFQAAQG